MSEFKTGLWKKVSEKGTHYCSGKIKIGATEYKVRLFNNTNKTNDKAPDFNLILKTDEIEQLIEKKQAVDPFEAFGESIEIEKEEIPF